MFLNTVHNNSFLVRDEKRADSSATSSSKPLPLIPYKLFLFGKTKTSENTSILTRALYTYNNNKKREEKLKSMDAISTHGCSSHLLIPATDSYFKTYQEK